MKKAYLNPDTLFANRQFGFSQAVTTRGSRLVYCAGQTARDKDMNLSGGGARTEFFKDSARPAS